MVLLLIVQRIICIVLCFAVAACIDSKLQSDGVVICPVGQLALGGQCALPQELALSCAMANLASLPLQLPAGVSMEFVN
jgi:hypothetical protein